MNFYEGLFLFDSRLASKDWDGLEEHLNGLFEKHGVKVVKADRWDERKLAYEIEETRKGAYFLAYLEADPAALVPLRRDLRIWDQLIRELILKLEPDELHKRLNPEAKQEAKEEKAEEEVASKA